MATERLDIIISAQDKATGEIKGLSAALGNVGTVAAGIIASKAFSAFAGILGTVVDETIELIKRAPEIEGVKDAYENFFGDPKEAQKMLDAMKESSKNMITNTDLMKSYNLASSLAGETFAKELPNALELLSRYSSATGEDMGYLLDSFTRGVSRLSIPILDNIGVVMETQTAYENFARSLGIAEEEIPAFIDDMTKAQQQTAFLQEALAQLETKTAGMETISDPFKQLDTTIQDLKDLISLELGPVVMPIIEDLVTQLADFVASDEFQAWIKETGQWLSDNLVPALNDLITNTGGVTGAFQGLQTILDIISVILWPFIEGWKIMFAIFGLVKQGIDNIISPFTKLGEVIDFLKEKVDDLSEALSNLDLGPLSKKSPSEFEISIWAARDALKELTSGQLPALKAQFRGVNREARRMVFPGISGGQPAMQPAHASIRTMGMGGVTVVYSPTFSAASRQEFEQVLIPLIDRAQTNTQRRRVERR